MARAILALAATVFAVASAKVILDPATAVCRTTRGAIQLSVNYRSSFLQDTDVTQKVFFDITIDGVPSGRIIFGYEIHLSLA